MGKDDRIHSSYAANRLTTTHHQNMPKHQTSGAIQKVPKWKSHESFSFWPLLLMHSVNRITQVVPESPRSSFRYMNAALYQTFPSKHYLKKTFHSTRSVSQQFLICFKCFKSSSITLLQVIYTRCKVESSVRSWDSEIWPKRSQWFVSESEQNYGAMLSWYCCGFPHPLQYLSGLIFLKQSRDWLVSKCFKCWSRPLLHFSSHLLHREPLFQICTHIRINAVCIIKTVIPFRLEKKECGKNWWLHCALQVVKV